MRVGRQLPLLLRASDSCLYSSVRVRCVLLWVKLYYTAAHLNVYLNIKCDETYQGGADGAEVGNPFPGTNKHMCVCGGGGTADAA